MIVINTYTGQWQRAVRRSTPPKVGTLVLLHDNPDARELDDFKSCLKEHGLMIGEWVRHRPNLRSDEYRIEQRAEI